jgi:hypothetical protein
MPHPTPLDLVFSRFTGTAFPAIQKALEQGGYDPTDRDAFLLLKDVVTLMHDLRPEEGIGEGMDYLVALGHHAYLAWAAGSLTLSLTPEETEELLGEQPPAQPDLIGTPRAYYTQFIGHQIWAHVIADEAAEPLDGCFVHFAPDGTLRVLGIFGLRPERVGFSAVETIGPRPVAPARPDTTPLFSSSLGAGRLHSLVGSDELLELGWRTLSPAHAAWSRAA